MLEHEDQVKENRQNTKDKLDDVEARVRVVLVREDWLVKSNGVDSHLDEGAKTSGEVKHYVDQTPADSALALPVQVNLRNVLDEGDASLTVAAHSDGTPLLVDFGRISHFDAKNGENDNKLGCQEGYNEPVDTLLFSKIVHKDLSELNR